MLRAHQYDLNTGTVWSCDRENERQKRLDLTVGLGGIKRWEETERREHRVRRRKFDREEKQRESTSSLSCVKIEACSLGHLLFSLTFCYLSLICFYLFTSLKSSCLHKLLLPFPRCLTLCCFSSFFFSPPSFFVFSLLVGNLEGLLIGASLC